MSGKRWHSGNGGGEPMENPTETAPKELTDRTVVNTPIGPVCMSRTEYAMYREALALRRAADADAQQP